MKRSTFLLVFSFMIGLTAYSGKIESQIIYPEKATKGSCSDNVFLRRTYLIMTGQLPTALQAEVFLKSKVTDKRSLLINELLESEAYVKYMVMRWGDILRIKSEFPSNLWPNGVQAYNRWLYEKISANTSYDIFVRELLLSQGSNFRSPAVNFYRAFLKRTPENIYQNISLLFLGSRKNKDKGYLCFSQIKYKATKEWKEEIIYIDNQLHLKTQLIQTDKDSYISLIPGEDWRKAYVNWLTGKQNRRFAAVMVNRMWFWIFGKGIVQEPDDWGEHNPPSDSVLLNLLTDRFIDSGYDIKAMFKLILNSDAYQNCSSKENMFVTRRMPAEVLVDALADMTGISDEYRSRVPEPFTIYPKGTRAVDLGDATVSSTVLELFGRVSRDISLESQRSDMLTSRQLLYLMNSSELEERIRKSPVLNDICKRERDIPAVCREITLRTFSRFPTPEEIEIYRKYAQTNRLSLRNLASEILWTQINSTEFLFIY
ncbi:MAG: DUF1553 domain-containing protein [Paludibacter sp.]|nr:DUF1553 domain-containing protein [Paludibacter sp.]